MMVKLHPIKISGNWHEGFALDVHTIGSTLIGYDQYGHEVFDTQRSPVGELLYRLKYRRDKTVLNEIVEAAANFITNEWKIRIEAIVPVPPSRSNRSTQPVLEIAKGISTRLGTPYAEAIVKVKGTPELKNIFDYQKRQELLRESIGIKNLELQGKDILIFDDLFRSGATLSTITRVLYDSGRVRRVYTYVSPDENKEQIMTKVFIGGSREVSNLNKDLKSRIDNIIRNRFLILIGDANGADKAVQKYLSEKNYEDVIVFCMKGQCRNNVGGWKSKCIDVIGNKKGFAYYSTKDLEMAKEADYGFLLWDAKSKGTLNNAINLLKLNKKILLYFYPDKNFYVINTFDNLKYLLSKCDKASLELFDKLLGISEILAESSDTSATLKFTYQESLR